MADARRATVNELSTERNLPDDAREALEFVEHTEEGGTACHVCGYLRGHGHDHDCEQAEAIAAIRAAIDERDRLKEWADALPKETARITERMIRAEAEVERLRDEVEVRKREKMEILGLERPE